MSNLIAVDDLLGIADRMGSQYEYVYLAAISGGQDGAGGNFYDYAHVADPGDPDIEIPLLNSANTADTTWTDENASDVAATLVAGLSNWYGFVSAMRTHFTRVGLTGSWDQYLAEAENLTNPTYSDTDQGVRVSSYFNSVYNRAFGNANLAARNVFAEHKIVLGTAEVNGSTLSFWDGDAISDGLLATKAGDGYAAAQLQIMAVGGDIGATDLDLTLTVKKEDQTTETIDVTVPAGTLEGATVAIGTVTDRYIDVTGMAFTTAGNEGTTGDRVEVQNIVERTIQL